MSTARRWLLIALSLTTAALAYLVRDAVYNVIVLPLAYLLWQLGGLLARVAQLVQWAILVLGTGLLLAWQLVPRLAPRGGRLPKILPGDGPVNAAAQALWRARSSNYFRWHLAHRLGRVASQVGELPGVRTETRSRSILIAEYLDAGLNHSFVDYAAPRLPFARPAPSPLDMPPEEVIQELESRLTQGGDLHVDSH